MNPLDLDKIASEIAVERNKLTKAAVPPKVYSKLRSWLKRIRSSRLSPKVLQQLITQKAEEISATKALAKNQVMASFYDSGTLRMDFGSDVPNAVKKAAIRWAKKRGLSVVEATLSKSSASPASIVFSSGEQSAPVGRCVRRVRWSVTG
jgi:hypothetical protein